MPREDAMSKRTFLIAMGVGVTLIACTEATGPPFDAQPPPGRVVADGALHHLRWKASPPEFTIGLEDVDAGYAAAVGGAPPQLDRYEASFWAARGTTHTLRIDYLSGTGEARPYLTLTIPPNALLTRPDGTPFQVGDGVMITVAIDTLELRVRFAPAGLVFSGDDPAQLQIWYAGADDDLNDDGVVDAQDQYIEQQRLGVWYQAEPGDSWYGMIASQSTADEWLTASLFHFSGYAVSY